MKWWQFGGILIIIVSLILVILFMVPGMSSVRYALLTLADTILKLVGTILVFLVNFCAVFFLAYYFRKFLHNLDERFEKYIGLNSWQVVVAVLLFGIVAGLLQMLLFTFLLNTSFPFHEVLRSVGGAGPFETPPIGWAIYGYVMFVIGYGALSIDWSQVQ